MKPTTLLWCAAVVAACANVASPSPIAADRLARARELLDTDPHAALSLADELLAQTPNWRDARMCRADGSRKLAAQAHGSQSEFLWRDAAHDLEIVVGDSKPGTEADAWRMLAECRRALGEYDPAAEAAMKAAEAFAARRTAVGRQLAASAILLAGDCQMQTFAAARQKEIASGKPGPNGVVPPGSEVLTLAANLASRFESVRAEYPAEACTRLATIWQWLGQDGQATAELERGIRATPAANEIHAAYLDWMVRRGLQDELVGAYAGFVRETPNVPVLRWHLGRSQFARADQLRRSGDFQGAIAAYGKALAAYGEYAAMTPADSDNAKQWLALCELSIARVSVELGDHAGAQRHLFAADEASAAAVAMVDGKPQLVDSFGSHYAGVVFALNRALAESGAEGVEKALAFNEAVLQRHPDHWGFVYNNAALPARDLGIRREAEGHHAEAVALWEKAYGFYRKAVALSPDDARIANDCGLMLTYYLDRDFDEARRLFDRAIAIGTAQLAALPQDADQRERQTLEEAVGDAWQNIAILQRKHLHAPFADYRRFCEEAVKFFPYERRAAATLLRTEGADDGDSPATAARLQGGAAEALAKVKPQVDAKAGEGDYDSALALLDGLAKDCKDFAPYHALRGELNLKLAAKARDEGRKGAEFFFQDAIAALKKAVSLDGEPAAPRQLLAQAQFDGNDLEGATSTISALLLHLQSKGGGKPEEILAAHTLRASAATRAYAAKKQEGKDDAELLTAARTSLRALEAKDKIDAALLSLWSATEQWAGAPVEAVNVYVRAVARHPEDQGLLNSLVETAAAQKQLQPAIDALQGKQDATILWYVGKLRYLVAAQLREGGKNPEALQALDAAQKDFTASMQKNESYRNSCQQWMAMCLGKKGNIAFRSDDFANAEKWLLEAVRMHPATIAEDLGLGESTKLGVLMLADRFYKKQDLGKVEAIYRAASDAAQNDLDLLNNSGLFARDYGNALEGSGKKAEAMAMYEQSYKAYRRATQLDGSNVRLRNDTALIAIHYLERDWNESKAWLDAAIADGDRMLAQDQPSDPQERQQLDEAVGDCYENLALWHLKHSKDYAAAKAAAEKSLTHRPGSRRPGARRHLQEAERLLQGK